MKVLDFGLARMSAGGRAPANSALPTEAQTRDGVVMGTVPYMSPEQVSGRPVDHRTDVFSLGVVLYEMASGRRPFEGQSSAELASAILRDTPPALGDAPELPPGASGPVIRRCLEKDARQRLQTARDVGNELRELPRESTSIGRVPGRRPRFRPTRAPPAPRRASGSRCCRSSTGARTRPSRRWPRG